MKIEDFKNQLLEVLSQADTETRLEEFVMTLSKKGFSRQKIYDFFSLLQPTITDNVQLEAFLDIVSRLIGWCGPGQELLANEKIKYN